MKVYRVLLLLCLLGCNKLLRGQIDTEFWFAAPEITSVHADRPIYLYISALDQSSSIKLSMPANPAFPEISVNLSANQTTKIDLTEFIDLIENQPANQILNKGLYLTATNPVTSYYEVFGGSVFAAGVNSDIFALKGTHALGTRFYTPFQTDWDNYITQNAWSSFDIVATEDNTTINITPTKDVVGHVAGVLYTIILNKGQTYSARASSTLKEDRPVGSLITSNKPIAVTTKDDSMFETLSYDTAGDQLIPVNILGEKYIATRVSYTGNDHIYILATEDNTEIRLNGNAAPVATISAGTQYSILLTDPTVYIEASEPVYVFHVGGFYNELGGALLPPLNCTGSKQVSFSRSTAEEFHILLLCEAGAESSFSINGNTAFIQASLFSDVAGSGGAWKYANIPLSATSYPAESTIILSNSSGNFHVGTVNGGAYGFRYGFFSDFGFLELGGNKSFCKGNLYTLRASSFLDSYAWYKLPSPTILSSSQTLSISDTGTYWVKATKGACEFSDTVGISFYPEVVPPILGNDTSACANTDLVISAVVDFDSYMWNTGSTEKSIRPKNSGIYSLEVENEYGCKKSDDINVTIFEIPYPEIQVDQNKDRYCKDSTVYLSSTAGFVSYLWSTGATSSSIITTHNEDSGNDFYWVETENSFGCKNRDTLKIDCSTVIGMIPNLITVNGDAKNDSFFIAYLKSGRWSLSIYNRWGQLVFNQDKYDNTWDAAHTEEGIYYYLLKHRDYDLSEKGWLHILRK